MTQFLQKDAIHMIDFLVYQSFFGHNPDVQVMSANNYRTLNLKNDGLSSTENQAISPKLNLVCRTVWNLREKATYK